jgi:hypothetical protein
MSARLRFTTAKQIFEAFPKVTAEIELRAAEQDPLDFARALLAKAHRFDAIVYAACLLPRREAVWWGCQCVRALKNNQADEALLAAEAWVRHPEDSERRAALAIGAAGSTDAPGTWLALAAGHSGGSISAENGPPVAAARDATAIYVKAGLVLAIARSTTADPRAWLNACVEAAIRFADGGDATVIKPK